MNDDLSKGYFKMCIIGVCLAVVLFCIGMCQKSIDDNKITDEQTQIKK